MITLCNSPLVVKSCSAYRFHLHKVLALSDKNYKVFLGAEVKYNPLVIIKIDMKINLVAKYYLSMNEQNICGVVKMKVIKSNYH